MFLPVADISLSSFLPLAIFGAVAAAGWWIMEYLANGKSRAVERLDELTNPQARKKREEAALKKNDAMSRVLEKASIASKPLQPKNEFEASKLKAKLASAGFRGESAGSVFLGIKFLLLVVGFVASGGTMLFIEGINQTTLMVTISVTGICFYLPTVVLALLARSRKQAIFFGLPDALDLLVVCVEAGLGLDQAMRKVADEMKLTNKVIAEEFSLSNVQLQMGRSRNEVLHELGARTGVDDLRSLAAILIQADKFGSSVAQALRVQSDSMRTRRRQIAEEKAAKTAVKLIFPLVMFIFPGIFVVLVGPAAITIIRDMFPKMGG
ncbi:MAG: type II secretion system F family protein [Pirellulales bacterium]|nr:type II secretion system F family protein [Pirellulales bacterium]